MIVTVEVTLYPLADEYLLPIVSFIESLRTLEDVTIVTNQMSTQLRGELDVVMDGLQAAIHDTFSTDASTAVVIKILNADLEIERHPDV